LASTLFVAVDRKPLVATPVYPFGIPTGCAGSELCLRQPPVAGTPENSNRGTSGKNPHLNGKSPLKLGLHGIPWVFMGVNVTDMDLLGVNQF
jgi:hypothetical protein